MKRPPILTTPSPIRRKRTLSGEELALWESVAKQAKPLRKKRPAVQGSAETVADGIEADQSPRMSKPIAAAPKKVVMTPTAPPPLAPMGRRERSQLSRGRKDIDARLDLHGMTQTRAHRALLNFLHQAHANGMTFVLVITGKGRTTGAETERGILRRHVPQWLGLPEFRSLIVSFEEAHIGHGGEGALYVRVRRLR